MSKDSDVVNLKRLIALGKDKGYITYEELNNDLPENIISSEHIDDVMMMFEELDIMVIDETAKENIEKSRKIKKKQEKKVEKQNFRTDLSDASARVSDPVKMYLKEMGCISLLSREGEVEIAKKIEAGEKETLRSLLKCGVGTEYIIGLGDGLKRGEIRLKDIINDLPAVAKHRICLLGHSMGAVVPTTLIQADPEPDLLEWFFKHKLSDKSLRGLVVTGKLII